MQICEFHHQTRSMLVVTMVSAMVIHPPGNLLGTRLDNKTEHSLRIQNLKEFSIATWMQHSSVTPAIEMI